MWYGGMKITSYNEDKHRRALRRFFRECNVENNSSMDALALHKRKNSMMFMVMEDDRIVNVSYAHDFSDYYPSSYRVFTRTATVPDMRGVGVRPRRDMTSAAGLAALTCRLQVDYALINGCDNILFTTNVAGGGMESSAKLGRFLQRIEENDPRFEYVETREIYGCDQMVWRLLCRDIIADPPQQFF